MLLEFPPGGSTPPVFLPPGGALFPFKMCSGLVPATVSPYPFGAKTWPPRPGWYTPKTASQVVGLNPGCGPGGLYLKTCDSCLQARAASSDLPALISLSTWLKAFPIQRESKTLSGSGSGRVMEK